MKFETFRIGKTVFRLATLGLSLAALAIALLVVQPAAAQPAKVVVQQGNPANDGCLACHSRAGTSITLEDGTEYDLTVSPDAFHASVHGQKELACVACHTDITTFPHPARTFQTAREATIQFSQTCEQCHTEQSQQHKEGIHQAQLDAGNTNAPVCADCHNPHEQQPIADMKPADAPNTCAQCHSVIFEQYKESVHGSALVNDGNPDAASCIDCHGAHKIEDPKSAAFRNFSPQLCATCHADAELMNKYGISTQVFDTYVADFHGTTVMLFQSTDPNTPTNKAVCTDCHGVHDILRTDDPEKGLQARENLLATCQKCHPGATADTFTDAWTGHYVPDAEKYPIVYYVNLFYAILIPAVLGGMGVFVVTDFIRRMIDRKKGTAH